MIAAIIQEANWQIERGLEMLRSRFEEGDQVTVKFPATANTPPFSTTGMVDKVRPTEFHVVFDEPWTQDGKPQGDGWFQFGDKGVSLAESASAADLKPVVLAKTDKPAIAMGK